MVLNFNKIIETLNNIHIKDIKKIIKIHNKLIIKINNHKKKIHNVIVQLKILKYYKIIVKLFFEKVSILYLIVFKLIYYTLHI